MFFVYILVLVLLSIYLKMVIGVPYDGFVAKKRKIFPSSLLFMVFCSTCTIGTISMFVRSKRKKERYKTITSDQSSVNAQSSFYSKYFVFFIGKQNTHRKYIFRNLYNKINFIMRRTFYLFKNLKYSIWKFMVSYEGHNYILNNLRRPCRIDLLW